MHRRIGEYAAIGNLETCPIVSADGSIEWCCFPGITSPSIFAGLLDDDIGGRFRISPSSTYTSRQEYVEGTNILKTVFSVDESAEGHHDESGRGILTDFMPIRTDFDDDPDPLPYRAVYRRVTAESEPVQFEFTFSPRFNYAQQPTNVHAVPELLDDGVDIPVGDRRSLSPVQDRAFIASPKATGPVEGISEDADELTTLKPTSIGAAQSAYLQLPVNSHAEVISPTPIQTGAKRPTPEPDGGVKTKSAPPADNETVIGTVTVEPGEERWFTFQYGQAVPFTQTDGVRLLENCKTKWRAWTDDLVHHAGDGPPFIDDPIVQRSALVLKLLMTQRTGAIAAAATTSLPEKLGRSRNWDYRFNWVRDSALAVRSLYRLGHAKEARRYLRWCLDLSLTDSIDFDPNGVLYRPLSRMDGSFETGEITLDHFDGYRDSSPVRIGNGADGQHQHDVYGYLADAVHEAAQYSDSFTADVSLKMRELADHVCRVWEQPDAGIWEVRNGPRHFVHSKLMCWVTLDRAISLVQSRHLGRIHGQNSDEGPERPFKTRTERDEAVSRWADERTAIREEILEHGYDEEIGSFMRSYETDQAVDATALHIPLLGFLNPTDERVVSTVETIQDRLSTDSGFVYRYQADDGVEGDENPFVPCSFWMVEALASIGRVDEAQELYDSLTACSSPSDLFAEEYNPDAGEHRGNYPQAFSHIGVIDAAVALRTERSQRAGTAPGSRPPSDGHRHH